MIPRHLTGYHLLPFDFETVLFPENPKIQQPVRRIVERGTKGDPIYNSRTKARFKGIEISDTISFTATGI